MSVMRYALNQHEILDGLSANRNYPETGLAEISGDFLEADFALPIWQVTRRGPNRVASLIVSMAQELWVGLRV